VSLTLEAVLDHFQKVQRNGAGYKALCPAHTDKNPSLSITEKHGQFLFYCHANAGCTYEKILAAAGIKASDLSGRKGSKARDSRNGHGPGKIVATYQYRDASGVIVYEKVRMEPKDFRFRRPDGQDGWIQGPGCMDGAERVLYNLPEILASKVVFIFEGEKDCDTAKEKFGIPATTGGAASDKWEGSFTAALAGRECFVIPDADVPGRAKGRVIAKALYGHASSVHVFEMPRGKDFAEWVELGGTKEEFFNLCKSLPEWAPPKVDRVELLEEVEGYVRRFVALSEAEAAILTLWIIHTHLAGEIEFTPYLAITSAEKGCGKTRVLEVAEELAPNPWLTGRVTAAVLYRKIDADKPTLLLDESDAAFGADKEYAEALRGVLNSGYSQTGKASVCVGQGANISFQDFSTFCPKAIAGIDKLPDTIAARSVPIRLKRATRSEGVEKFRKRDKVRTAFAANLRAKIEIFADEVRENLDKISPLMPEQLTDRQQDISEILVTIADLAGGKWPGLARKSLVALCTQASAHSIGEELLGDIRKTFDEQQLEKISSADLVHDLCEMEGAPWAEWGKAEKPITPSKMARLLHRYGIQPHTIRLGAKTIKGYEREDFADAWRRYLTLAPVPVEGPQTVTTSHPAETGPETANNCDGFDFVTDPQGVTALEADFVTDPQNVTIPETSQKRRENTNENAACDVVTVCAPSTGMGEKAAYLPGDGYVRDTEGPGVRCATCGDHYGTFAGWRAHRAQKRCTPCAVGGSQP
jgi:hypothetical protein